MNEPRVFPALGAEMEGFGEPEWMPSAADVARARAQMERSGVVQSLARDVTPELVPAGEVPWLWWGAAALWIIAWPALIALTAGGRGLPWLPWWLLILLAVMHMLILAGPVFLSERQASRGELRRRFGTVRTLAEMLALEPVEFETWTGLLFRLLGYEAKDTQHTGDHGIDLIVSSQQIRYGLVQCKRYRGTVGEPTIRDLYGTMMHEQADYGWLVTTGAISRQARAWVAGKPMDLWDGQKLVELARQLR